MFWDGERWLREDPHTQTRPATRSRRRVVDWLSTGVMVLTLVALIVPAAGVSAVRPPANTLLATWSSTSTVDVIQETSGRIAYSGRWSKRVHASYLGGKVRSTNRAGARATLKFKGAAVAWVGPIGPTRGKAKVYIDGRLVKTVNTWASSFKPTRVLFQKSWASVGTHSIRIVASGTAGHPTVALDAFLVRRTSGKAAPGVSVGSPTPTPPPASPAPTPADDPTATDPDPGAPSPMPAPTTAPTTPAPTLAPTPTPTSTPAPTPTPTVAPTPTPATGRTYYLAPNGNDSADGSIGAPKRTILAASKLLRPGDTLLVRGGTYHDPGGYNWASTASGTATAPITVRAYPGETPVFDGGASAPATGWNAHPQQAIILKNVAYVTVENLTFTRFDPWNNGMFVIDGSRHITFRGIRGYGQFTDWDTEHYFYIMHGSSNVLIENVSLDGIAGAAVHVYDSEYVVGSGATGSSTVTVRNSRLTNNGKAGILAGSGLAGGSFTGNYITSHGSGIEFNTPTTGVTIRDNDIKAPVGIYTNLTAYGGYGPAAESGDCIDSPVPFKIGWPGTSWTLAQWQAAGYGAGTTVGACGG